MIKQFKNWLSSVRRRWHNRGMYVVADARDNSITFSRRLFNSLNVFGMNEAKVYVFRLCNSITDVPKKSGAIYAFMLNPALEEETQFAEIQYNTKHKCIGFESLCPTVNRIFYDYGISANICCKLSVQHVISHSLSYYIIMPPYDKSTR